MGCTHLALGRFRPRAQASAPRRCSPYAARFAPSGGHRLHRPHRAYVTEPRRRPAPSKEHVETLEEQIPERTPRIGWEGLGALRRDQPGECRGGLGGPLRSAHRDGPGASQVRPSTGRGPLGPHRRLGREGGAAPAGALHVRVAELEAGAVEALDVVDLRPVQVLVAQGIDVELDALVLERLVEVGRLVLEVEVVREARAAAADDAEAQALARPAPRRLAISWTFSAAFSVIVIILATSCAPASCCRTRTDPNGCR